MSDLDFDDESFKRLEKKLPKAVSLKKKKMKKRPHVLMNASWKLQQNNQLQTSRKHKESDGCSGEHLGVVEGLWGLWTKVGWGTS